MDAKKYHRYWTFIVIFIFFLFLILKYKLVERGGFEPPPSKGACGLQPHPLPVPASFLFLLVAGKGIEPL